MNKFLVTGGAGFIGSHIVERLLKDGHSVVVLDNFSSGKKENLSFTKNYPLSLPRRQAGAIRYTLIKGDIRDKSVCKKASKGVDFILHHAALRSVPGSMRNPSDYNQVNIQGTLNMLEAARDNKIKGFVLASSSSIYGEVVKFPQRESDPSNLISPYALSKLAGEYYCKIFSINYGLNTVSLRYFNVFGPRQAPDDEYAVVIPKFIVSMLKGEAPPIFGTGKQSRDFVYIDNIVDANLKSVKKMKNLWGNVFNVAEGKDYAVLELVCILNKIMGKKIKPAFLAKRPGDVFKTLADLSCAEKVLGYKPRIGFAQGLRLTVEYFRGLAG